MRRLMEMRETVLDIIKRVYSFYKYPDDGNPYIPVVDDGCYIYRAVLYLAIPPLYTSTIDKSGECVSLKDEVDELKEEYHKVLYSYLHTMNELSCNYNKHLEELEESIFNMVSEITLFGEYTESLVEIFYTHASKIVLALSRSPYIEYFNNDVNDNVIDYQMEDEELKITYYLYKEDE